MSYTILATPFCQGTREVLWQRRTESLWQYGSLCVRYTRHIWTSFFFFTVMKTRSSFPPTYFIKLFTTSVKFESLKIFFSLSHMYEYNKISSLYLLKMQYPISFSYENLNFYCNCTVVSIFKGPMDMGF